MAFYLVYLLILFGCFIIQAYLKFLLLPHIAPAVSLGMDALTIIILGCTLFLLLQSRYRAHLSRFVAQGEALRRSEERFRLLVENAYDIVYRYRFSPYPGLEYISPAVRMITGYTPEEFYADPALSFRLLRLDAGSLVMKAREGAVPRTPVTLTWTRKDGAIVYLEHHYVPVFDGRGDLIAVEGVARDVTARKLAEERLRYLSQHDDLTGLYNRAYFTQAMARFEEERPVPVGVVVCDVDGLKLVNDTMGHKAGDALLVSAARLIRESFRKDDVVARIGGDEFAVLLPWSDSHAVEKACQKLRDAVDQHNVNTPPFPLSISVGFVISSKIPLHMNDLFKEADLNMYREKMLRHQSPSNPVALGMLKIMESHGFTTEDSAERLKQLAAALGLAVGLPLSNIASLRLLAQFHDIGKIGIPKSVLFKPGPLSPEEIYLVKRHCEIGYRIAQCLPTLAPIADLILKHHEWWNGQGYPLGLKGENIPLECRILSIAEAFEAMTRRSSYRQPLASEDAVNELKRGAGSQFDPRLVEEFIKLLERIDQILLARETD